MEPLPSAETEFTTVVFLSTTATTLSWKADKDYFLRQVFFGNQSLLSLSNISWANFVAGTFPSTAAIAICSAGSTAAVAAVLVNRKIFKDDVVYYSSGQASATSATLYLES